MPTKAYVSNERRFVKNRISSGRNNDCPNTARYPVIIPRTDAEKTMLASKRSLQRKIHSFTQTDQNEPGNLVVSPLWILFFCC